MRAHIALSLVGLFEVESNTARSTRSNRSLHRRFGPATMEAAEPRSKHSIRLDSGDKQPRLQELSPE